MEKELQDTFKKMFSEFTKIHQRFDKADEKLESIDTRLDEVGKVAYETHDLVEELITTRDDHEYRLGSLERSHARLRLLFDR